MSRKELSLEERQKIKDSLRATKERRKVQTIKVFELKVNCHHTSKETFKKLNECFKQASVEELINTSLNASRLDLQINLLKRKQKATPA